MARPCLPLHPRARGLAAVAFALVTAARLIPGPTPAAAVVQHGSGYAATVLGWTSWYGSYWIGDPGAGWCIDHGSRAPDPSFGYAPTTVDDQSSEIRTAMAWLTGQEGDALEDGVQSAAMMLTLHDLMGASYPFGALDVDTMTPAQLAGFGGDESAVLDQARAFKADALAHASLVAPYSLQLEAPPVDAGEIGTATATLRDAMGVPVAGVAITPSAQGAALTEGDPVVTGADGTSRFTFSAATEENRISALATAPDLDLHAYASTTVAAQRVAVPSRVQVEASTTFTVAPMTTTTTVPTTTTAAPSTTTTAAPSTTSPTTTPTTAAPATTSTAVATSAPSTVTTAPADTVLGATPVERPTLPRTGAPLEALSLIGAGLVLLGFSVRRAQRMLPVWPNE